MEKQRPSQQQESTDRNERGMSGDTAKENIARQQETKVSNQRTSSGETSTSKDQTALRDSEVERSKDHVPDMPN